MTIHQENTSTSESAPGNAAAEQPMNTSQPSPSIPPIVTPAPAASAPMNTDGLGSLFLDIIVMAIVAVVVSLAVRYFAPNVFGGQETAQSQIVVINTDLLMREQIFALGAKVSEGSVPVAEMTTRSSKFTEAMLAKVNAYADEGKIVLRGDSVIAAPATMPDLTDKIREELQAQGEMERPVARKN